MIKISVITIFPNCCLQKSYKYFLVPSSLQVLHDLSTVEGQNALHYKFVQIPTYYQNHISSLIQFGDWESQQSDKIHKLTKEIKGKVCFV